MQYSIVDIFSLVFLFFLLLFFKKNKTDSMLYIVLFLVVAFIFLRFYRNSHYLRIENFYNTAPLEIYYPPQKTDIHTEKNGRNSYTYSAGNNVHHAELSKELNSKNKKYQSLYNGTWTNVDDKDSNQYQVTQLNNLLFISVQNSLIDSQNQTTTNLQFELLPTRKMFTIIKSTSLETNPPIITGGELYPEQNKIKLSINGGSVILLSKVSNLSSKGFINKTVFYNPVSNYTDPPTIKQAYETCESNGYKSCIGPSVTTDGIGSTFCTSKSTQDGKCPINSKDICSMQPLVKNIGGNSNIPPCNFVLNSKLSKNYSNSNSISRSSQLSNEICSPFYTNSITDSTESPENKYFIIINALTYETLGATYNSHSDSTVICENTFITSELNTKPCSTLAGIDNIFYDKNDSNTSKFLSCVTGKSTTAEILSCANDTNLSSDDRKKVVDAISSAKDKFKDYDYDKSQFWEEVGGKLGGASHNKKVTLWQIMKRNKGQRACEMTFKNIPVTKNNSNNISAYITGADNGSTKMSINLGSKNQLFMMTNISDHNKSICYSKLKGITNIVRCNLRCNNSLYLIRNPNGRETIGGRSICSLVSKPTTLQGEWIIISIHANNGRNALRKLLSSRNR